MKQAKPWDLGLTPRFIPAGERCCLLQYVRSNSNESASRRRGFALLAAQLEESHTPKPPAAPRFASKIQIWQGLGSGEGVGVAYMDQEWVWASWRAMKLRNITESSSPSQQNWQHQKVPCSPPTPPRCFDSSVPNTEEQIPVLPAEPALLPPPQPSLRRSW